MFQRFLKSVLQWGVYENFLKVFEAYLINKQIVFQNNIIENYYKQGDPNYVETFQDCIRMPLILHICNTEVSPLRISRTKNAMVQNFNC